jgi:integration host factor subunit beta
MNKRELIQALKEFFFNSMTDELATGGRAEVRGSCSFFVKEYDGYIGRNPKTGEQARVKPKKLPFFKPGKELKERVDQ